MYVLETERLGLRKMEVSDADYLMEIFSDPVAMQYYPSTFPREVAEKWIGFNLKCYDTVGVGFFVCVLKTYGEFVGQCGIVPQVVDGQQEMELGYMLARRHWGKGFATEAALACRDYGFYTIGLDRLVATIFHLNTPSIKVAERLSMKFEKRSFVGTSDDVINSIYRDPVA